MRPLDFAPVLSSEPVSAAVSAVDLSSPQLPVAQGTGLIFVVSALLVLLIARDVAGSVPDPNRRLMRILSAALLPLLFTFAGIVLFESIRIING